MYMIVCGFLYIAYKVLRTSKKAVSAFFLVPIYYKMKCNIMVFCGACKLTNKLHYSYFYDTCSRFILIIFGSKDYPFSLKMEIYLIKHVNISNITWKYI